MGKSIVEIDQERSDRFYNRLRQRMISWLAKNKGGKYTDIVLLAPDLFVLLTRLLTDKRVSARDRAIVAGALVYFISPIDLIPDILFPAGIADDVLVAAVALSNILRHTDAEIIREHWEGTDDVLEVIQRLLQQGDKLLGSGALRKAATALNKRIPK